MSLAIVLIIVAVVLLSLSSGVLITRRRTRLGRDPVAPKTTSVALEGKARPRPGVEREPAMSEQALLVSRPAPEESPAELLPKEPPEVLGEPPRLRERLGRARELLAGPLVAVRARGRVDEVAFNELEEALILADVGLSTTTTLLDAVRVRVRAGEVSGEAEAVIAALQDELLALFSGDDPALHLADSSPSVWLFVGVNGVGKTTTIGKLAFRERALGRSVVLAAGDTFRAAAVEQLATWAERSGAEIVRGADGADPSSVVFDAIAHAAARRVDLVLADSAGRLHTKVNLMEELAKVRRVADRPPGKVTEVLLVLDATTGQNGLAQARQFAETAGVTGIVLTKLDGTAKGGIVCSIRAELGLPIKLVGLGEDIADLVEFDPREFAAALLG